MPSEPSSTADHDGPPPPASPVDAGSPSGPPPPSAGPPRPPGESSDAAAANTAAGDDHDVAPHRLPVVSMLSGLRPQSLASALPALFVAYGAIQEFAFVGLLAIGVLTAAARIVHWRRFRWGFDGQVLHVHSGLVWRSKRAVDVARIQQVELERPLLHRFLGTALLRVETAADAGETEVALNGLEVDAATQLRDRIGAARRGTSPASGTTVSSDTGTSAPSAGTSDGAGVDGEAPSATPAPPTVEVFRPSVADLVRHAVTGRSLLLLPAGLLFLFQFGDDLRLGDDLEDVAGTAADTASTVGVVALVLVGLVVTVVVGLAVAVGATLLKDWELVLVREGDDLRLSRGLLDQRSATVPMQRLQVVEYKQNWLRRRFGVGTVQLRSAGGSGGDEDRRITVPWVPQDAAARILSVAMHGVLDEADDLPMRGRRHPSAARRRLLFLWLRGAWLPIVGLAVAPFVLLDSARPRVLAVVAGLLALATALAWLASGAQYRRLGHEATDRVVLVTGGVFGRTSTWMPLGRLQGVEARANPFQRRLDLVTVVVAPAGGANQPVEVRDVALGRATELGRRFVSVAAGRITPVDSVGSSDGDGVTPGPRPAPA